MKEDQVIEPNMVSLRQAGKQLGINYREVRGMARLLGIPLHEFGPAKVMSRADFERITEHMARDPLPTSATTVPA